MNFKVGQTVIHKTHGLGVVQSIETREFGDKTAEVIVLHIEDNGAPKKVFVPIESASDRLRTVVSRETALKALSIIRSPSTSPIDAQTWNRRYREYMERVHSGDLLQLAEVIQALRQIQADKDLSFGERKLLDCATSLVQKEFDAIGLKENVIV